MWARDLSAVIPAFLRSNRSSTRTPTDDEAPLLLRGRVCKIWMEGDSVPEAGRSGKSHPEACLGQVRTGGFSDVQPPRSLCFSRAENCARNGLCPHPVRRDPNQPQAKLSPRSASRLRQHGELQRQPSLASKAKAGRKRLPHQRGFQPGSPAINTQVLAPGLGGKFWRRDPRPPGLVAASIPRLGSYTEPPLSPSVNNNRPSEPGRESPRPPLGACSPQAVGGAGHKTVPSCAQSRGRARGSVQKTLFKTHPGRDFRSAGCSGNSKKEHVGVDALGL